jgi:hypothetical protein
LDNGSSHEILSASWNAENGRMASGCVWEEAAGRWPPMRNFSFAERNV